MAKLAPEPCEECDGPMTTQSQAMYGGRKYPFHAICPKKNKAKKKAKNNVINFHLAKPKNPEIIAFHKQHIGGRQPI